MKNYIFSYLIMYKLFAPTIECGDLITGTSRPQAMDKINRLEAAKVPVDEPMEVNYDTPTITQHLNNVDVLEKGSATFQCKLEPSNDPTMKIGKMMIFCKAIFKYITHNLSH